MAHKTVSSETLTIACVECSSLRHPYFTERVTQKSTPAGKNTKINYRLEFDRDHHPVVFEIADLRIHDRAFDNKG